MVPQQAPQERPPAAKCAHCACNLSRYRSNWEQHCAPCQAVLVAEGALVLPAFDPAAPSAARAQQHAVRPLEEHEKAAQPRLYQLCKCGRGHHKRRSRMCQACYKEGRRAGLTTTQKLATGRYDTCACGRGLKRCDRDRCRQCYNEARRSPGAKWGATCRCGGAKSKGAEMCMRCRYGIIAA